MEKATVYVPDGLKAALKRAAEARSGADVIREAVRELVRDLEPPKPGLPLFFGGDPMLAERIDEDLRKGLGG